MICREALIFWTSFFSLFLTGFSDIYAGLFCLIPFATAKNEHMNVKLSFINKAVPPIEISQSSGYGRLDDQNFLCYSIGFQPKSLRFEISNVY